MTHWNHKTAGICGHSRSMVKDGVRILRLPFVDILMALVGNVCPLRICKKSDMFLTLISLFYIVIDIGMYLITKRREKNITLAKTFQNLVPGGNVCTILHCPLEFKLRDTS